MLAALAGAGPAAAARPDLRVTRVSIGAGSVDRGRTIKLGDITRNVGHAKAGRSRTSYLLSPDATASKSDVRLGSRAVKAIRGRLLSFVSEPAGPRDRSSYSYIEDGIVVGAVNNFRFNESPVELLGRITEVGATEITLCREWNDYFNKTAMPPIRVPDFNMSTVSQAS